jgi:hypothetical protein
VLRALALLRLAQGMAALQVARLPELTPQAIRKIPHRCIESGLDRALYEKQRPGASELPDNQQKQRIVAMVCGPPPEGRASKATTSSRGGKKMWCVPELNDEYTSKMEDVLEVYERPNNPEEPVVCLDEKPVTLHADVRAGSPAEPEREARYDNECERRGSANIFCAVEPKAGRHFTWATPDRSAVEFAKVVIDLATRYPKARTIHLVLDNLNIHHRKSLTDLLGEDFGGDVWGRFTVHYTPTNGSWLNQAEIEIGILSRQCLGRRRIPDLKNLRSEVRAWNRRINQLKTRINSTFTRRAARRTFGYKKTLYAVTAPGQVEDREFLNPVAGSTPRVSTRILFR